MIEGNEPGAQTAEPEAEGGLESCCTGIGVVWGLEVCQNYGYLCGSIGDIYIYISGVYRA